MADEKKDDALSDDKSINELLQEYADAEDVKDKDLDDFLKTDDDAFADSDEDDDDAEEESEKVLAEAGEPRKRGGGFLTMLLIVIAFGAAGAGAYVYLNRDEGMTSIMGGFAGGNEDVSAPPVVSTATVDETTMAPAMPEAPAQPMPIMNEPVASETPAPAMPAPITPTPGADLLAVPVTTPEPATQTPAMTPPAETAATPAPEMPAPPTDAANAPAQTLLPAGDANAAQAVSDWTSGNTTVTPTPEPANTDAKAALPEKPVAEVKAKPVKAPKQDAAKEPLIAAKKTAPASSGMDGALPPPYVAIQSKKGGNASASASPKMAPVVEGGAHRDLEGNTNANVADTTKATGDTAAMVANGGGKIVLPGTTVPEGVPAPVGMMAAPRQAEPVPLRTIPLAINGGVSRPDTGATETRAFAQIPDTTQGTKPATPNVVEEPRMPAVPVESVSPISKAMKAPATSKYATNVNAGTDADPEPLPSADTEPNDAPMAAPSSSSSSNDASALVSQAQAAEKAGRAGDALELYQQALEADAVYGDGKSIDRGAVYDRIGAIRAGH